MSVTPLVVYLHGFLSSPQSKKAQQTLTYFHALGLADNLLIPQLQGSPQATISALRKQVSGHDKLAFIGSSLGGFYATCMAEHCRAPAVLINPAVRPHDYWQQYVGEHRSYHSDEIHLVTPEYVRELEALAPTEVGQPENYQVYLQKHDEVLDYRRALSLYGESHCIVHEDGDHSFENFHLELPQAIQFLLSRIDCSVR